jgi:hypothetical protein
MMGRRRATSGDTEEGPRRPAECAAKTRAPDQREESMALHQAKEFGWVGFWIAFIIALFVFFIPTVNRALNL